MSLERELDTYRQNLPELLADSGKFVLIHGRDVVGTFGTLDEALSAGYDRTLTEPFLVRQISGSEPMLTCSRRIRPCPSSPAS